MLADALVYLGLAEQYAGDLSSARRRFEECLPVARRFGDRHTIAMTLNMLGQLAVFQGKHDEARRLLRETLLLSNEAGNVRRQSLCLSAVATLAKGQGELALALKLDAAAQAAARSVGTMRAAPARAITDREMEDARATLGEPAATAASEAGRRLSLDRAVDVALAWLGDDEAERRESADAARWQESPWTVFGWTPDENPDETGVEMSGLPTRAGNGGNAGGSSRVYGEGGALPPR